MASGASAGCTHSMKRCPPPPPPLSTPRRRRRAASAAAMAAARVAHAVHLVSEACRRLRSAPQAAPKWRTACRFGPPGGSSAESSVHGASRLGMCAGPRPEPPPTPALPPAPPCFGSCHLAAPRWSRRTASGSAVGGSQPAEPPARSRHARVRAPHVGTGLSRCCPSSCRASPPFCARPRSTTTARSRRTWRAARAGCSYRRDPAPLTPFGAGPPPHPVLVLAVASAPPPSHAADPAPLAPCPLPHTPVPLRRQAGDRVVAVNGAKLLPDESVEERLRMLQHSAPRPDSRLRGAEGGGGAGGGEAGGVGRGLGGGEGGGGEGGGGEGGGGVPPLAAPSTPPHEPAWWLQGPRPAPAHPGAQPQPRSACAPDAGSRAFNAQAVAQAARRRRVASGRRGRTRHRHHAAGAAAVRRPLGVRGAAPGSARRAEGGVQGACAPRRRLDASSQLQTRVQPRTRRASMGPPHPSLLRRRSGASSTLRAAASPPAPAAQRAARRSWRPT